MYGVRDGHDGVDTQVDQQGRSTGSNNRVERARTVRELFLLDADAEDAGWQDRALCAQTDPEAFFPEKGGSTREAKKVCLTCDVRGDCLEYALMNDERFGIWGGLSERERRKLKKRAV
jgi:WhiB family transcriptional regulator, redox-sensing transcriptional regulator